MLSNVLFYNGASQHPLIPKGRDISGILPPLHPYHHYNAYLIQH